VTAHIQEVPPRAAVGSAPDGKFCGYRLHYFLHAELTTTSENTGTETTFSFLILDTLIISECYITSAVDRAALHNLLYPSIRQHFPLSTRWLVHQLIYPHCEGKFVLALN